jgi:hypothetical protein
MAGIPRSRRPSTCFFGRFGAESMPALRGIGADSAGSRGYIKPRPAMSGLLAFRLAGHFS